MSIFRDIAGIALPIAGGNFFGPVGAAAGGALARIGGGSVAKRASEVITGVGIGAGVSSALNLFEETDADDLVMAAFNRDPVKGRYRPIHGRGCLDRGSKTLSPQTFTQLLR